MITQNTDSDTQEDDLSMWAEPNSALFFARAEVEPLPGCKMLKTGDAAGAIVLCVSPGASIEEAVRRLRMWLEEDLYRVLKFEYVMPWDEASDDITDEVLLAEIETARETGMPIYGTFFTYTDVHEPPKTKRQRRARPRR